VVTNNTLTNTVRPFECQNPTNNVTVTGNTINGSVYSGINIGAASGTKLINNNVIYNMGTDQNGITLQNNVAGTIIDGNEIYGARIGIQTGSGTTGTQITNNKIHDNIWGAILVNEAITILTGNSIHNNPRGIEVATTSFAAHYNSFYANDYGAMFLYSGNGTYNVTNNWWGANDGPNIDGAGTTGNGQPIITNAFTGLVYNPWLKLNLSANPDSIAAGGGATSAIRADMTMNSDNLTSGGFVPDGTQIVFTTTSGSIGSLTTTKTTASGIATATLTSAVAPGTATVTAAAPGDAIYTTRSLTVAFTGSAPVPVNTPGGTVTVGASTGSLGAVSNTAIIPPGLPPTVDMPYGVISFTVSDLAPGTTVTMTFILPTVPPANLQFWKYINGAWVDCSSLLSGVADGNNTVFVTITDGGLGDQDGLANGVIVDPCAFVYPSIPMMFYQQSHGASMPAVTTPQAPVSLPSVIVQSASLSANTVSPGSPVTVTADITNKSTVNGIKKVTLYVNGQVESTQGITVNSGGSSKLTFSVSRNEPGTYSIYVDGVPAGSLTVSGGPPGEALIFAGFIAFIALILGLMVFYARRQRSV